MTRLQRPARRVWSVRARAVAAAGLTVLPCCTREAEEAAAVPDGAPTAIVRGFTTTVTSEGMIVYELQAPVAYKYGQDSIRAQDIRVRFYEEGQEVAVLTARSGLMQGERVAARGNVVVVSVDGDRLETESLYWDPETEKIRSNVFVRITREDEVTTATGFVSDVRLQNIQLFDSETIGTLSPEPQR